MTKWQPIETAPTDGTAVLLWPYGHSGIDGEVVLGYFDEGYQNQWFNPERREWFEPTHWMPLPEPP